MRGGRAAALFFVVVLHAPAGDRAILDRVVQAYEGIQGYEAEVFVSNAAKQVPPGSYYTGWSEGEITAPSEKVTVLLIHNSRDRLRVDDASHGAQMVVENDAAHRGAALTKFGLTDYAALEDGLNSAKILRKQGVEVDGVAVPCYVIEARYPRGTTRLLWVDETRYAVLREIDRVRGSGISEGMIDERVTAVQKLVWDRPIADSVFDAKTPAGLQRADGSIPPVPLEPCRNPKFTDEAGEARLGGMVKLEFTIDTEGTPIDIRIVKSLGLGLDESAVECVARSRYRPASQGGIAIAEKSEASISFFRRMFPGWRLGRAVFHVEEGASRPVLVVPKYPRQEGKMRYAVIPLHFTIDKEGIPRDIEAAPGAKAGLGREAARILRSWRFDPGIQDGRPIEVAADFDLVAGNPENTVLRGGDPH